MQRSGRGFVPLIGESRDALQRRRSPAKPDGLGGVVSLLNGTAVILVRRIVVVFFGNGYHSILQMIGSEEMAAQLGVAKETIEAWARDSKIPAFKVGRSWKFDEAEVLMALKLSGNDLSRAIGRAGFLGKEPRR
jgi:excisionase family DNA binding protein